MNTGAKANNGESIRYSYIAVATVKWREAGKFTMTVPVNLGGIPEVHVLAASSGEALI